MTRKSIAGLPMPDHPVLRQVAQEMERLGKVAQLLDRSWRFAYISSEMWGVSNYDQVADEIYEMGHIRRQLETSFSPIATESQTDWWRTTAPYMRFTLEPGTPEFDNAFGPLAEQAAQIDPVPPPPVWGTEPLFAADYAYGAAQHLVAIRIDDYDGSMLGVLEVSLPALPGSVTWMLSLGDTAMFERMAAMADPHRCPSALLFCDIEASGELSRTLSSKAYFDMIRSVTTAVDHAVASHGGIVGRHAGDGASAFFSSADYEGSQSAASRAALETARAIRKTAGATMVDGKGVDINCGIHWGGTIVMGQVSEGGRLEITALGDEVNEAARIESAAQGGATLVSKAVIERLEPDDAAELGIDPDTISYTPLGRLEGVSDKTLRDASTIPVAEL